MVFVVDRDESLTLNAGNAVAFTTDFGASAPAAPTDPTAVPAPAFIPVGACDQTGLTEGFTETTVNIMAIGILSPFRVLYTEQTKTFQIVMLEAERDICQSVMFKTTVASLTRAGGLRSVSEVSAPIPDRRAWLFRIADGAVIQQFYVPQGEITTRANVAYSQNDVAKYDITLTTYPDANGITCYRLDNAPVTPAQSNS
jgi:hypothetical protein